MTNRAKLAGSFLVALAAVACGGGSDATTTTAPPAQTSSSASAEATITIAGFAYSSPAAVSVGQEVRVVNEDSTPHTWTSTDGLFDSGSLSGGEAFTHTFDEAGEYSFFCGIHPQMTGSITVGG